MTTIMHHHHYQKHACTSMLQGFKTIGDLRSPEVCHFLKSTALVIYLIWSKLDTFRPFSRLEMNPNSALSALFIAYKSPMVKDTL